MTLEITFSALFAGINSVDELKATAQNLIAQIQSDYTARAAQIVATATTAPETPKAQTAPKAEAKTAPAPKKATPKVEAKPKAEPKAAPAPKKAIKKAAPKAEAKPKAEVKDVATVSLSDTAALAKLNFTFEPYSEKCWVLRGDTKAICSELNSTFNGKFNRFLRGGEGWVFTLANAEKVAKALNLEFSKN